MLPSNVRSVCSKYNNDSMGDGLIFAADQVDRRADRLYFSRKIHCVRWNNGVYESRVANDAGLIIDEKTIEYPLRRYELVDLEIIFCEDHHA